MLMLTLVFVLFAAMATLSLIERAAVARQRAAAAADVVALAVASDAGAVLTPGPCPAGSWAVAEQVAGTVSAAPLSCQVLGDGSVLVQVRSQGPGLGVPGVSEWARAGPTPVANPP